MNNNGLNRFIRKHKERVRLEKIHLMRNQMTIYRKNKILNKYIYRGCKDDNIIYNEWQWGRYLKIYKNEVYYNILINCIKMNIIKYKKILKYKFILKLILNRKKINYYDIIDNIIIFF
tara:strand:- start:85 stop:438 length:354 start_codon:yes stop_codon:yes gene_type:complete